MLVPKAIYSFKAAVNLISRKLRFVISLTTILFPFCADAQDIETYQLTDGRTVAPLDMFRECDDCPEMIVIPLGSFMMGAKPEESRNRFDIYGPGLTLGVRGPDELNIIPSEHPRHPVQMDIAYAMGRNEVTHAEWMRCVEDGGCSHEPDHSVLTPRGYVGLGPDHPVVNVSYLDALEYVAWLNSLVGTDVYRLPTEAEWEYAARAGTETRFAQGDELTADQANFSRTATEHVQQPRSFPDLVNRNIPVPVMELDAANGWGLRHMSGNVYELTMSCWSDEHLGLTASSDYLADASAQESCGWFGFYNRRVAKGGAFTTAMDGLRLAARIRPKAETRYSHLGFRVVREFVNF